MGKKPRLTVKTMFFKIKNFLLGHQGTILYCPFCKSQKVLTSGRIDNLNQTSNNTKTYTIRCTECGSKGTIKEKHIIS